MNASLAGLEGQFMSKATPSNMFPGRDNLEGFEKSYLKKSRTWFGPDVVLLTATDEVKFVMKDWSQRPAVFRKTWCSVAARREIKVYEKLRGMAGVPQLISVLSQGFIMEWLDARPLPRRKMRDLLGMEFFTELEELVRQMHARGVAHGDLRRRNILRGVDGKPRLIDFETAVTSENIEQPGKVFRSVCEIDYITILKIRARYFPESVSPEEQEKLDQVPWHLATGRYIRQNLYGPLTSKGRRKRRKKRERENS